MTKKSELVKVTVSGGFHNSHPINIKMPRNIVERWKEPTWDSPSGECDKGDLEKHLSKRTYKRLLKHMCGMSDCLCEYGFWVITY